MNVFDRITARAKGDTSALSRLHPELDHRVHMLTLTDSEQSALRVAGGYRQATSDYAGHVWVQKAISVIANALAPLPLQVVDDGSDEPLERHPIADLLRSVNDTHSSSDLWKQWVTDMLLGGESGLELVKSARGDPLELWPRQPVQFTVVTDAQRRRYYGVAAYKIKFDAMDRGFELPPEEFVHFKFYNPANPWRGLAPIEAVRMGIVIDQLAQAWSRLFFANSTRPDLAVMVPQGMTKSERESLEDKLMARFGGVQNAHRAIVLEEGVVDIKPVSYPPKDLEWVQQRQLARDEVGAIFGVPDEIMGYGKDTYENFQTARQVLWTLTLVPLLGYRDTTLTEFCRRYGYLRPNERIATDTSDVSELQEDYGAKLEQAERLFKMGVPLTLINERLALGLADIPGGELPYAGRSPGFGGPFDAPVTPRRLLTARTKQAVPAFNSEAHQARMKELDERQEPHVQAMQRELKRQFQRQQIDVLRALRNGRNLGRGRHLDDDQVKLSAGDLFDLTGEIGQFQEAFRKFVEAMLADAGALELARVGGGDDVFDIQRPAVQLALETVLKEMAEKTNNTTWEGLVDLFRAAEAAGESIPEIAERLSAFFEGRKSDYETERIARTTMVGADNAGALEAYDQSGIVSEVAWLAALDDRVRPAHEAAHGQRRKLGESFDVGGESLRHPGDPKGSPGNIINCRCGLEPIVEK